MGSVSRCAGRVRAVASRNRRQGAPMATEVRPGDADLKARHRAMWASGDYPAMVQTFLLPLGPRLLEACGIAPGMPVPDGGAGTRHAATPAARTGADVTASDLTPELLNVGRARVSAEALDMSWVEADA